VECACTSVSLNVLPFWRGVSLPLLKGVDTERERKRSSRDHAASPSLHMGPVSPVDDDRGTPMPRLGQRAVYASTEWAAQVAQAAGRTTRAPRHILRLDPGAVDNRGLRSSLSFPEVMSLHILTYPYARGSSSSVAHQFMRSLGALRLWGGRGRPFTLGVGRGRRARPVAEPT
jgi:hypothetical protein